MFNSKLLEDPVTASNSFYETQLKNYHFNVKIVCGFWIVKVGKKYLEGVVF